MMNIDELEAEAMKLDLIARTELARRLAASLASAPITPAIQTADERERLWIQEAMRRSRELRQAQPANPTAPSAQTDLAFSSRAAAAPQARRKKPAPRPAKRKPAKRAKPPARAKHARKTQRLKTKAKARPKLPKPSRSRR